MKNVCHKKICTFYFTLWIASIEMLAISKKQFAMLFSLQKVWVKKHGNKKLVVLFALFLYVHPITFEIKWTILIVRKFGFH